MRNKIEFSQEELETSQKNLEKLKKIGIIITKAAFNAAVDGADGTPENSFDIESHNMTRRSKMWLLPNGSILCEQEDEKNHMVNFIVPATFKFAHLK